MSNFIRKSILMGFGLVSLSREKAEEFMDDLVKRGEISEKEGRETVDEMIKKSKEMKKDLSKSVDKAVKDALKTMNVVSRDEFDKLKKKVTALEKASKSGE